MGPCKPDCRGSPLLSVSCIESTNAICQRSQFAGDNSFCITVLALSTLSQLRDESSRSNLRPLAKARFFLADQAASSCDHQPSKICVALWEREPCCVGLGSFNRASMQTDWRIEWPGLTTFLVNALQRVVVIILAA